MRWSRYARSLVIGALLAAILPDSTLAQNGTQNSSTQIVQPAAPLQPAPPAPAVVMIDAAHGGSEPGAMLNPAVPEKDVTLVFARRLRQELGSRGISTQIIRDNDVTISADQRAETVNSVHPVLYIAVHASSLGTGVSIFAAMPFSWKDSRGPFVNWQAAQAGSATKSLWAQQELASAIRKTGFPVRALLAPLRPLNNVNVPALAFEFAPTTGNVSQLTSTDYQQMTCAALANAIAAVVPMLRSRTAAP
ncbi:MAG: hypothetical protein DMG93_18490 [Acidobacteria bacterium]|nr:MAG: hypothetical protein DMG93_18490 [Acidobacteriota bacterium]